MPRGSFVRDTDVLSSTRLQITRVVYAVLLLAVAGQLAISGRRPLRGHLVAIAALVALSVLGQLALHRIQTRVVHHFDMGLGLVLVAVVIAGPIAGAVVAAAPDVVFLARRRQAPWRLWAAANWTSCAGTALAGAAVLSATSGAHGPVDAIRLFGAGVAMLLTNYVLARLVLAVGRDGARPGALICDEVVQALPLAAAAIAVGTVSALLIPELGVFALAGFAAVIYSPQLVVLQLLRAPSVAALSVDDAAGVYREALADEVRLSRAERRLVHIVDALARREPLPSPPANPFAAAKDALLVTICTECPPSQKQFTASLKAQVVLVAREWAQLTARCTPALSHHEALAEMHHGTLARDAPLALAAAQRIADREHALTEHVAGVPRLHRAPLPRALRTVVLPVALSRLAG